MSRVLLPRHGRNHRPGGSDPIPGLVVEEERAVACRAGHVGSVAITTGVDTSVDFDSTAFDTDGFWDAGDPERFVAPYDGIYIAYGDVAWDSEADTAYRESTIRVHPSGSEVGQIGYSHTSGVAMIQGVSAVLPMDAGDYATLDVLQTAGANRNYLATAFWIQRISAPYDYSGPLIVSGLGAIDGGGP